MTCGSRVFAMALGAVCLVCLVGSAFARDESTKAGAVINKSILVESIGGGEIDWGKQMIYATGEAPMPSKSTEANRAKAYLKAKGYARMAAVANLMLAIGDTVITYDNCGKDLMDRDESLRKRIEGYIEGLEIISDEKIKGEDGAITAVRVTVGTRMYGQATPGAAIVAKLAEDAQANMGEKPIQAPLMELPERVRNYPIKLSNHQTIKPDKDALASSRPSDPNAEPPAPEQVGPFTSLIIDARGYGVLRAISPKIRKLNGDEVWGTVIASPDYAIENGIVAYAQSEDTARACDRCGKTPLYVKAVGRAGGKALCDVIISDESAKRVLGENSRTSFLDEYKVIFIIDPPSAK